MTDLPRCKECKYLTGRRSSVGIECIQPDNQKKWNKKQEERIRNNAYIVTVTARFKQPSMRACKRFEPKEDA